MKLHLILGDKKDLAWAQETVVRHHYLHQPVSPRARPMAYIVKHEQARVGLIITGIPHAVRNWKWWGYPGLPNQWQVVDLCRIWINPNFQQGGCMCSAENVPGYIDRHGVFRSTMATWMIQQTLARVQKDRVALWPPVYLNQPYHILLAISYHDPRFHRGTIYKYSGATPMYVDADGQPTPGPSGKFGWCWRLPDPDWEWFDLANLRARQIRMI